MKNNLLVLSVLSIVVIVLLAFAFLRSYQTRPSTTYENEIRRIETTSESDEVESIEEDLEDTDVESIDSELTLIEAELN